MLSNLVRRGEEDIGTYARCRQGKGLVHFTINEKFRVRTIYHYIGRAKRSSICLS